MTQTTQVPPSSHTAGLASGIAIGVLAAMAATGLAAAGDVLPMELGSVRVNELVRREIPLRNESKGDLVVMETRSSCPCLRVIRAPETIPAGASAPILIEYRTTSPGRKVLELFVQTLADTERNFTFHWEGNVQVGGTDGAFPIDVETKRLLCTVDEVTAGIGKGAGLTLIDGRSPAEFNASHIAGAMNWPLRMLRNLAALKDRDLVIYGNGSDDRALAQEAQLLATGGFRQVHVLKGGLRGWIAAGHSITCAGGGISGAMIEPRVLQSLLSEEWLVLDLKNGGGPVERVIDGAIGIRAEPAKPEEFLAEVRRQLEWRTGDVKVLFTSRAGESYELIESKIIRSLKVPVFYLKGGSMGYQEFLKEQNATYHSQQMTLSSERDGTRAGSASIVTKAACGCGSRP